MKKIISFVSTLLLVVCCFTPVMAQPIYYKSDLTNIAKSYNIEVEFHNSQNTYSQSELDTYIKRVKSLADARTKNKEEFEKYENDIKNSGRLCSQDEINQINTLGSARSTEYDVVHNENIGSYYPASTAVQMYYKGLREWSSFRGCYLWTGDVQISSYSLFGSLGEWSEHYHTISLLDGGRTKSCKFHGSLGEEYTEGGKDYLLTTEWDLWFEAYCN